MSDNQSEAHKPVSAMSFEEALRELETIVRQLESGNVPLEKSIAIYDRGNELRKHCDALLKSAEAKVEKIQMAADGTATGTKPLDVET